MTNMCLLQAILYKKKKSRTTKQKIDVLFQSFTKVWPFILYRLLKIQVYNKVNFSYENYFVNLFI